MPKSIRNQREHETRCLECSRLLATQKGIKCPRCKKINTPEENFATILKPDQYTVASLWTLDGGRALSITIRKDIWLNLGHRQDVPNDRIEYAVFYIFNDIDPSKAFAKNFGNRVNNDPILDFNEALTIAKQHEADARASGKWVNVEDIREPRLMASSLLEICID